MPLKHLAEYFLAVALDNISMARDDGVKVPLVHQLNTVVVAVSILAREVPVEALHPLCVTVWALDAAEDLVREALLLLVGLGYPAVLLGGRQVEDEIRLDEHLVRLVEEGNLQVAVAVDILVVEVGVELFADLYLALVGLLEDDGELLLANLVVLLLGPLLREALGADDLGVGEGCGPFRDEDVVLNIWGDDVPDGAT